MHRCSFRLFFCSGLYWPTCADGWYMSNAANVIVRKSLPYDVNYPYIASPDCTLQSPPEIRVSGAFTRTSYADLTLVSYPNAYGATFLMFVSVIGLA